MADEIILTTPPVHGGPEFGDKPIIGGDAVKTGLDARLREAFEAVVTEFAAKTSLPVVSPTKQLIAATLRIVNDLPRVPDYDDVSAREVRWSSAVEYSPIEVPDADPDALGVYAKGGVVCVDFDSPGNQSTDTLEFDPAYIESFFLAGLAACAYAKAQA